MSECVRSRPASHRSPSLNRVRRGNVEDRAFVIRDRANRSRRRCDSCVRGVKRERKEREREGGYSVRVPPLFVTGGQLTGKINHSQLRVCDNYAVRLSDTYAGCYRSDRNWNVPCLRLPLSASGRVSPTSSFRAPRLVVVFLFVFFHGSSVASCHSSPPGASVSTWKEVGGNHAGPCVSSARVFLRSVPLETLQFFAGLRASSASRERAFAFSRVVGDRPSRRRRRLLRLVASIDGGGRGIIYRARD